MKSPAQLKRVAIACGGTGGHLFPGLAVADELVRRGFVVSLIISPKEVDQQAVKTAGGMEVLTLPAVGLTRGNLVAFVRGCLTSYRLARKSFRARPPQAVLAMGGFTSAPPILAGKSLGAQTFLHESNTIPGRANRWLSRVADRAFVSFPDAAGRLRSRDVTITGTPVRRQFQPRNAEECRAALGLEQTRPLVLVMGGSQGASAINQMIIQSLPGLASAARRWQWLHLTGEAEAESVRQSYLQAGLKATVKPFFLEMELALGAATAAVSRAGGSSLAELAAMRVPAMLIPFPAATDNHQFFNARAFEETGAARLLAQNDATPQSLIPMLQDLVENQDSRLRMQEALAKWHNPNASRDIAQAMAEGLHGRADRASTAVCNPGQSAVGDQIGIRSKHGPGGASKRTMAQPERPAKHRVEIHGDRLPLKSGVRRQKERRLQAADAGTSDAAYNNPCLRPGAFV